MHDSVRVEVFQAGEDLLENALEVGLLERDVRLADTGEFVLGKLEDEVLCVSFRHRRVVVRLVTGFHELDDVFVARNLLQNILFADV